MSGTLGTVLQLEPRMLHGQPANGGGGSSKTLSDEYAHGFAITWITEAASLGGISMWMFPGYSSVISGCKIL